VLPQLKGSSTLTTKRATAQFLLQTGSLPYLEQTVAKRTTKQAAGTASAAAAGLQELIDSAEELLEDLKG
jgi:hypothetical protein